jgi:hypothetical protein
MLLHHIQVVPQGGLVVLEVQDFLAAHAVPLLLVAPVVLVVQANLEFQDFHLDQPFLHITIAMNLITVFSSDWAETLIAESPK